MLFTCAGVVSHVRLRCLSPVRADLGLQRGHESGLQAPDCDVPGASVPGRRALAIPARGGAARGANTAPTSKDGRGPGRHALRQLHRERTGTDPAQQHAVSPGLLLRLHCERRRCERLDKSRLPCTLLVPHVSPRASCERVVRRQREVEGGDVPMRPRCRHRLGQPGHRGARDRCLRRWHPCLRRSHQRPSPRQARPSACACGVRVGCERGDAQGTLAFVARGAGAEAARWCPRHQGTSARRWASSSNPCPRVVKLTPLIRAVSTQQRCHSIVLRRGGTTARGRLTSAAAGFRSALQSRWRQTRHTA